MKNTHILFPCYLSFKLGHSEQKNNIIIDTVVTPFSSGFGYSKNRGLRNISLYSTKLRVINCKILIHQGRQFEIDDYEGTLTGINVFPLWSHDVSTVTPNRITNSSEIIYRIWRHVIRSPEFLCLRNLGILQIKVFFNNTHLRKGIKHHFT